MADPVFSPDGKWMWSGSEWIPAPPGQAGQQLNMQDSVIGGDVVHNTTINNDPTAVTEAVITALQQMGMLGQVVEQAPPPSPEIALPTTLEIGSRVFVNWKNYGHYYAGKVAKSNPDGTYLVHFDDGDVEDHVNMGRIKPLDEDSEVVQAYIEHDSEAERELIEAFQVFDTSNSGTIPAREYLRILTEIGDDPIPVEDVLNEFVDLGIELDSEIDYRALAKFMVASEQVENGRPSKQEVVIHEAAIEGDVLTGYAYEHPILGEGRINTSAIVAITYDARATARVDTQNTVYIVGPTGWKETPDNHPFNDADNHFYTVQGAGTSECNGTYHPSTEFDGVPSYINGDVLLLRWKMGNGDQWWYLANRNSLDRKRGDYYRVKSSSDTPPSTGWMSDDQTEGVKPFPSVQHSGNPPVNNPYSVGQQVKIEWNGQWYDGQILEVNGESYRITYDNYSADWDEWVDPSRLKSA